MTAQEIVEALCEAQDTATAKGEDNSIHATRRDAIKAALVEWMDLHDGAEDACGAGYDPAIWHRLEEACRGKA